MSKLNWTIIDTENGVFLENFEYKTGSIRISKRRLYGGFQDGVDIIEIDNGKLSFTVCPTRGMGVLSAKCGDLDLKWDSPARGPVHPKFVRLSEASGLGWLDGFSEWVVRCGLESNGSPEFNENGSLKNSLHGKIANIPAYKVELSIDSETGEINLTGIVEETRMFFKRMELQVTYATFAGTSDFTLHDKITNLSAEPGEFVLLYHINTGRPLVSAGAKIVVPYDLLAPRNSDAAAELDNWNTCDPETPGSNEVVYFVNRQPTLPETPVRC